MSTSPLPSGRSAGPSEEQALPPTSQLQSGPHAAAATSSPSPWTPKARSCIICRSRKVRCDKLSPCSNCRRANIPCVFPSNERPPKWARRLEASAAAKVHSAPAQADATGPVVERLRNLESLVKDLRGQLEQAHAAASSSAGSGPSSHVNSPEQEADHQMSAPPPSGTAPAAGLQKHFGRMVLKDANRSRYISSGFWSRVNDELDGLKMDAQGLGGGDSDTEDDEDDYSSVGKTPSVSRELERTPSERHAFLFQHNLGGASTPDLRDFRPLPSQIPFLVNVFAENINCIIGVVHIPSINKMVRSLRGSSVSSLTPANEALMFSLYYAAIVSMDDEEVVANFGSTKPELSLKYRLGLEYALAKADFLNIPDLVLVQAFGIFVALIRLHDSPRFVWMMTGLVIRMGQALGLQRDGSHFKGLTPFEIQMRRRIWWALCMLDIRAAEDQGTDFTITTGSFDTKLPLNISDDVLGPETKEMPPEEQSLTDMTLAVVNCRMGEVVRRLMALGANPDAPPCIEDQSRLINELYENLEQHYLQYKPDTSNMMPWVAICVARLLTSKMTLLVYLPMLFSPSSEGFTDEIRDKLLVCALEIAEYNHALNSEPKCRQWRWVYQTYTHWYAIVFLLIEVARRPWSPIVERAWVALHSVWLIPAQPKGMDKNARMWVPLRNLMAKAHEHRESELDRLRTDLQALHTLEINDRNIPTPSSSPGRYGAEKSEELSRQHWRSLFPGFVRQQLETLETDTWGPAPAPGQRFGTSEQSHASVPLSAVQPRGGFEDQLYNTAATDLDAAGTGAFEYNTPSFTTGVPDVDWSAVGPGFMSWPWSIAEPDMAVDGFLGAEDIDMNMGVDGQIDWLNWLESTKGT
ncbi:fungal-specific transcription factor domain-containing protein [Podospora didyma]|uniref:Fungal-specific transcription factor domain-containing protein n=1 Tax=Podospora didyma TaxID=330526 RepID=A0AAE0N3Y9_9PEZI|nr:fungal-specific transcription factor domain-containing protein [Podospora didyma]